MKMLILPLLFFTTYTLHSQNKDGTQTGNKLIIKGYIDNLTIGDSVVYALSPYLKNGRDTAIVKNGNYSFEIETEIPTLVTLYSRNPADVNNIQNKYMLTFISEPTVVKINSGDDFSKATIRGSKANVEYVQIQSESKPFYQERYNLRMRKDSTEESRELKESLVSAINGQLMDMYYDYLIKNPKSYLSLFLIDDYLTVLKYNKSSGNLDRIIPLYSSLPASYKDSRFGLMIKRSIDNFFISVGTRAPYFVQPGINCDTVSLATIGNDRLILLDFWASWCGPCRKEHPNLIKLYRKYRRKGFSIISVSVDTDREKWLDAIKKDKLPWLQLSDLKADNEAAKIYKVTSVPQNFLINSEGMIVGKNLVGEELEKKLKEILK